MTTSLVLPDGMRLPQDRTLVMGILNVTPDSFSDGGLWVDPARAIEHAHVMLEQGADLIDIGGESTRPHSSRIDSQEEWDRIAPVVTSLAAEGVCVSVDTLHADTAIRAAAAGAAIINDVSGGCFDSQMLDAVAQLSCAYIIQHYRGLPGSPDEDLEYGNVVDEVRTETLAQVGRAISRGISPERIIIDPGLGFALTQENCAILVDRMAELTHDGYPVLIGASRKRFLAGVHPDGSDAATCDITRRACDSGVWAVRVHEVLPNATIVRSRKESQ